MGRQELLQPCCSSRCAGSVPVGHDTVLTPLGVCDGDRWGQTLLKSQPALRAVLSEDEEVHDVTIIRLISLRFSPDAALAGAG